MEELVKNAQRGDEQAFRELMFHIKERLYRTACKYLKNENDALEAMAEVTCRAYISLGKLKDARYFTTWITRILINYCLDELKHATKNILMDEAIVPLDIQDEEMNMDVHMDLMSGLEMIPDKYRTVIVLRYLEDCSVKDIAKAMNKPEGTVKTWLSRGLRQLRSYMEGCGQNA